MGIEFQPFPKIGRLKRNIIVTEKIDGTNAAVRIVPHSANTWHRPAVAYANIGDETFVLYAQSRNRFITADADNYGFAAWVHWNAEELVKLGEGIHYGEWWGRGIQRGYGLKEKRFSLFNVGRWNVNNLPACCQTVPVLYEGPWSDAGIESCMGDLALYGSYAAPGFMKPEGVVIFHGGTQSFFKQTFEHDETGKEAK